MSIQLLKDAAAGVASTYEDVHSCGRNPVSIRVSAKGSNAGDLVNMQQSPDSGTSWFDIGQVAVPGELVIEDPLDWVRAVADGGNSGTVTCFIDTSA